jgi:hypothetical protein
MMSKPNEREKTQAEGSVKLLHVFSSPSPLQPPLENLDEE